MAMRLGLFTEFLPNGVPGLFLVDSFHRGLLARVSPSTMMSSKSISKELRLIEQSILHWLGLQIALVNMRPNRASR